MEKALAEAEAIKPMIKVRHAQPLDGRGRPHARSRDGGGRAPRHGASRCGTDVSRH
jgi:hypothetical protein